MLFMRALDPRILMTARLRAGFEWSPSSPRRRGGEGGRRRQKSSFGASFRPIEPAVTVVMDRGKLTPVRRDGRGENSYAHRPRGERENVGEFRSGAARNGHKKKKKYFEYRRVNRNFFFHDISFTRRPNALLTHSIILPKQHNNQLKSDGFFFFRFSLQSAYAIFPVSVRAYLSRISAR